MVKYWFFHKNERNKVELIPGKEVSKGRNKPFIFRIGNKPIPLSIVAVSEIRLVKRQGKTSIPVF